MGAWEKMETILRSYFPSPTQTQKASGYIHHSPVLPLFPNAETWVSSPSSSLWLPVQGSPASPAVTPREEQLAHTYTPCSAKEDRVSGINRAGPRAWKL